jgi:alkylation response protein AidB-like acyl-CoA dehydrogenase
MRWLGQMQRAFDLMCSYSLERKTFGEALAEKQTIQNWIADSAAQMQAARLMTLHAAWKMDTEGASAARQDIALIKFFGAGVMHEGAAGEVYAAGHAESGNDLPVLLATEVCSREVIHAQKCMASRAPESMQRPRSRRRNRSISLPARNHANGASTSAATVSRTAATASEDAPSAWAKRIRIAANETTTTPTPRTRKGRARAGMARYITPAGDSRIQ